MELLKKLAEALELDESELKDKLNLTDESSSKDIAKALGVYGLFQEKIELENYVKTKVQNKMSEVDLLKKELEIKNQSLVDFETSKKDFESKLNKVNAQILNSFEASWKKLNLPEIDFSEVNVDELDINDLRASALNFAKSKNLTPILKEPVEIKNDAATNFNKVEGVQIFDVGVKRSN
ncbi:hypothetical protein [Metamycoplasma buccale]|uniref:hypothetical protein n=1 Tax=Metamycoplasma buccale TaxID=55602 RepID=UPI00398E4BD9